MRRIISFMHVSLDGFVAGPKGEMNWIKVDEEIFDQVGSRVRNGDTALYGRVTYQMMESYWPAAADKPDPTKHEIEHSAWYKGIHKIVLSRTLSSSGLNQTTVIGDHLAERINELRQGPGEDIFLFGSPTATHSLMQLNLIDGYWLFVNPVVLGQGIPLFSGVKSRTDLTLLGTRQFNSGVTELSYVVDRK